MKKLIVLAAILLAPAAAHAGPISGTFAVEYFQGAVRVDLGDRAFRPLIEGRGADSDVAGIIDGLESKIEHSKSGHVFVKLDGAVSHNGAGQSVVAAYSLSVVPESDRLEKAHDEVESGRP